MKPPTKVLLHVGDFLEKILEMDRQPFEMS